MNPDVDTTKPFRVLILEDRASDAEVLLEELRRAGVQVDAKIAATGDAYAEHLTPDLDAIISDFNLPQFGAREALELLQAREFDIPFLVVSGAIGEETAVELIKLGAVDYVSKARLARVPTALVRAVEAHKLRREKMASEEALGAAAVETATIQRRHQEQYRE
ncbi:MAG: response regulator, partial [Verrucomicrobiota bacterium]|nr:response regulator [Verrucomicrobiota bacterium]